MYDIKTLEIEFLQKVGVDTDKNYAEIMAHVYEIERIISQVRENARESARENG